jgi:hypothetical protein
LKLDKILFVIVLAMCAVVVALMLTPQVEGQTRVAHPSFQTMRHGGAGAERHAAVLWLGWGFGALSILSFVALAAFGARKAGSLRGLGWPLICGVGAYLGLWTWLVVAYRDYASEVAPPLVAAFPLPTAIMMYLLWPVPAVFSVFFVAGFGAWVYSEDDLDEYRRLLSSTSPSRCSTSRSPTASTEGRCPCSYP